MAGKKKVRTLGVPVAISMDRKVKQKAAADISMERYFIFVVEFRPRIDGAQRRTCPALQNTMCKMGGIDSERTYENRGLHGKMG